MSKPSHKPTKIEDHLTTKSLQTRRGLEDEHRKSLKSFEINNSVFVINDSQHNHQTLKQSINNPKLHESLDGDLERIKN